MSFSTSNCSLPPSSVADQISCLICAFSSHHRVPSGAQLIRRDQLYSHIADHLNYRDGANAYMDILCNMTFGHCVQIDFAKRLNQLPKGRAARTGGNSGASPMQISLNDIPSSSILSSLSSIPSNLLSSPVIRTTTTFPSSSSVVQLPLTPIPLAAREGPSENDTQQTVEQSTKTEELLNGSHELKVERNSGINNNNNNEEDAVQYFNNLPNESQLSLPDFEMDTERAENTAAQKRRRKQSMTNSSTPRAKKRRKSVTTNKEVEALNNWTMLVSPRSNRKCKTVASKNISKTFTSARRPIVAKNGASAFQMKGASVLRSAAWKGNGQQRQSDRTLERQSDRTLERQSDRTLERQSDRTLERQSDRTLEERMPKNAYFDCTCKEPLGINK